MSTFIPILFHVRDTKTRKFTWRDHHSGQHGAGNGQAQLHQAKHSAPFSKIEAENSAAIGLWKRKIWVTDKKGEDVFSENVMISRNLLLMNVIFIEKI